MPDHSPHRVSSSGAPHESAGARRSAEAATFRGMVLAAIVVGVLVGAMACAAGLGGGGHRGAHAASAEGHLDVTVAHHEHRPAAAHTALDPAWPADGGDGAPAQGHPGMACVVSVELRFPDPVARSTTGAVTGHAVPSLAECLPELDPPVPRLS